MTPTPTAAGGDRGPRCQPGQVWQLGEHTLTVGTAGLTHADLLCHTHQQATGRWPALIRTGEAVDFTTTA